MSMNLKRQLLFLLGLTGLVFADNFFQILSFPKPSTFQVLLVLGGVVLIVVFVVLYEAGRRSRERRDRKRSAQTAFNLKASDLGLTDKEKSEVQQMAGGAGHYQEMNSILASVDVFEQYVEQEVRRLMATPDPYQKTEGEDILTGLRKKLGYNYLESEHPLISTRNISVGQPLTLLSRQSKAPIIHQVRVVSNKELFFRVQYDAQNETQISLQRGDRVLAVFARYGDAMYQIELTVAAFDRPGWIDFYHTLHLGRRQLRKDVRLDVNFPIKFRLMDSKDPVEKERLGADLLSAKIADISGGGLSFINDSPLKPEDVLSLNFSLSETPVTGVQARLLRVNPQQGKDETVFKHHMQYLDLDPAQKEKIVKYVFEKMRQKKQQEKE
jgi:c-di-GMP-binding flagellar brake protein YcgR